MQGIALKNNANVKKDEVSRMIKEELRIPMNLQLFADGGNDSDPVQGDQTGADGDTQQVDTGDGDNDPSQGDQADLDGDIQGVGQDSGPTMQELLAEVAKLKRAQEKAASEAAAYKKKYNEKLSEKERIDAEKAERDAEKDEELQQLKRDNKINKLEKYYLGELHYTTEEAESMAIAEVDEDFDAKLKIQLAVQKRQKREYEAEFIKNRPQLNAGTGDRQLTKEQFDAMGMAEKSKLYRENEAEYNRLNAMK